MRGSAMTFFQPAYWVTGPEPMFVSTASHGLPATVMGSIFLTFPESRSFWDPISE